ncbi:MAG: spermidine synthase [Pseudomonadota bacterium]
MNDSARQRLFHATDDFGTVEVWRAPEGLILGLGNDIEQTRVLPHSPHHLCFGYMRLMLLTLLWKPKPRRALILGMGGGALARMLMAHFPKLELDAVELRPAVVEAAHEALGLPRDPRLAVHIMDAGAFARNAPASEYDLILTDLFDAQGMVPLLTDTDFQRDCARILAPRGALASNLWRYPLEDYLSATIAMEQAYPWLAFVGTRERDQSVAFGAHDFPGHLRDAAGIGRKHQLELPAFWRDLVQQNPAMFKR